MSRDGFRFFHRLRVRYSEIDAQGVVFNAHYLTYFDTASNEYFRWLDFDQFGEAKRTGEDFHVVRAVVEYKRPIPFDLEIDVGTRPLRVGNSSLTFAFAIFARDENEVLATGEIVWVNADQTTHRSVPLPKRLRELIAERDPPG